MQPHRVFLTLVALALGAAAHAFTIPWGPDPSQLEMVNLPEQERVGPLTFTISPAGTILVTDSVRHRVNEYTTAGAYLRTFCSGVRPSSIKFDSAGNLLMLDGHTVSAWNQAGQMIHTMQVPDAVPLVEGYAQDVFEEDGRICVNDPDEHVYCFDADADRPTTAATTRRGRAHDRERAFTRGANRHEAFVQTGRGRESRISPDADNALGVVIYRGRSPAGNALIEVEEIEATGRVRLKIKEAGHAGCRDLHDLPNDYFTTVYRKFEVQPDGSIWQMYPTDAGVEFIQYEAGQ